MGVLTITAKCEVEINLLSSNLTIHHWQLLDRISLLLSNSFKSFDLNANVNLMIPQDYFSDRKLLTLKTFRNFDNCVFFLLPSSTLPCFTKSFDFLKKINWGWFNYIITSKKWQSTIYPLPVQEQKSCLFSIPPWRSQWSLDSSIGVLKFCLEMLCTPKRKTVTVMDVTPTTNQLFFLETTKLCLWENHL